MATRYEARRPITHKGVHYRAGDEITGFTGWWRYWQYLRYASVIELPDVLAPSSLVATRGDEQASITWTNPDSGGSSFTNFEYELDGSTTWVPFNPAITDPPGVITGLTNGQQYSVKIRAVTVEDPQGAASGAVLVTPATVPSEIEGLIATPAETTVSIVFDAPADGGDAITDIQYRIDAGAWTSNDPETVASPIVIAGLTGATEYSVELRAVNTVGNGVASVPVVFNTDAVPDAPTALVATIGNETVSIAFTPGADNGAAITNYKYTMNDGVLWTAFAPADTTSPVVIAPLPNDVEYTVKLRAVNAVGDGAISAAVVFTPTDQVPAAPTDLVATPGVLSASIAFTAPDNGGSAITDYEYTMNGGVAWSSGSIVASPLVLDPIPAVETTVSIRAVNAVGNGPASASVTFTPSAA